MHQEILAKSRSGPVGEKPKCEPANKPLLPSRPVQVQTNAPLVNGDEKTSHLPGYFNKPECPEIFPHSNIAKFLPTQATVSKTKGLLPQFPGTAPKDPFGIVKCPTENTTSPSVPTPASLHSPKPSPRKLSAKCTDESSESANKVATQGETSHRSLDDNKTDTPVGIIDLTSINKSCGNLKNTDTNVEQKNFTVANLNSKFASACKKASKTITNLPVTSKPEKKELSLRFVSNRTPNYANSPNHIICEESDQNILEKDPYNCKLFRNNESSDVDILKDIKKGNFNIFVSNPTVTVTNVITTSSNNSIDNSISSSISSNFVQLTTNKVIEDKTAINDSTFFSQKDKKTFEVTCVETKTSPQCSTKSYYPTPVPRQCGDKARPKPKPRISVAHNQTFPEILNAKSKSHITEDVNGLHINEAGLTGSSTLQNLLPNKTDIILTWSTVKTLSLSRSESSLKRKASFSNCSINLFRSKSVDSMPIGSLRPKTEQTRIHSMSNIVNGLCESTAESLPTLLTRHLLKARKSKSDVTMPKYVDQINDSNKILLQQRQLFSDTVNTGNFCGGKNTLGNYGIHIEKSHSCNNSHPNRPTRRAPTPPENLHVIKSKTQNSDHKPNFTQESPCPASIKDEHVYNEITNEQIQPSKHFFGHSKCGTLSNKWSPPIFLPRSLTDSPSLDKPSLSSVQQDCVGIKKQPMIGSHSHSDAGSQYINAIIETSSDSESDDQEKITDKDDKKLFMIAKEVASSERVFVDVLKLLNVDFRNHISCASTTLGHDVIPASVLDRILEYLPQLQNFNEELLKDLDDRIVNWDGKKGIADVFVKKGPFLKLYSSYIRDFSMMTTQFDDSLKKYPEFKQACREFEMSSRCASLALQHYMLKPVQRIPQYKLLLQEYMKHLPSDSPEMKDTQVACAIVIEVADHANDSMKHEENVQKLMDIQKSIIGDFEVIRPGRIFIKKGELMKLSRKEMQPKYFFLFNDVLLYTTPVATGYKLNYILPLTGMTVSVQTHAEYKLEFNIISTQRSFTIHGISIEERDDWVCALNSAIDDIVKNRTTIEIDKNGLPNYKVKDIGLGEKAPPWIPDDRVTMCKLCTLAFTVTRRRHHCRACGWVVCGNCSNNSLLLGYKSYKLQRVCDSCYSKLHQDQPDEIIPGTRTRQLLFVRPERLKVQAYDEEALMSGFLQKWVPGKKWKKYWFLIKNNVLYTFKATKDTAAKESMVLLGYAVQQFTECYEGVEPNLLFQLVHKNTLPIVFRSDSAATTMKWVDVILQSTVT